ncbi:LacI family transcriptional regulator [Mycolicibacterium sp. 624]
MTTPPRGRTLPQLSMKQLAELAGLDVSTVSRALRGDNKRVAAATIARVQQLAEQTGFVADPNGANLRSGRTHLLGVVVSRLTDIVMGMVVTAIDEAARSRGYLSTVVATHDNTDTRTTAISTLLGRRVDGLILCDSQIGNEIPHQLANHAMPFVFAMRGCDDELSFAADDVYGGHLVAAHFLENGHRDIAVIPGPPQARTAVDRVQGFTTTVRAESGARLRIAPHGGFQVEDGFDAVTALLADRAAPPTAIFCTNDHTAIGASRALVNAGLKIGRDTAVAGYNDLPQSAYLETPLTSVRTDITRMGHAAAEQLIELIEKRTATSLIIKPKLIVRDSTSTPRR